MKRSQVPALNGTEVPIFDFHVTVVTMYLLPWTSVGPPPLNPAGILGQTPRVYPTHGNALVLSRHQYMALLYRETPASNIWPGQC